MVIRNNSSATIAYSMHRRTSTELQKNLEKLSSGYRINRASNDAAGIAVSEKLRMKITETDRCQRNASEGINVTRTADAALQEINDILKRARNLCVESMNGVYSSQELNSINNEISMLFSEIDRITASTQYNSINLFRREESTKIIEAIPKSASTNEIHELSTSTIVQHCSLASPHRDDTPVKNIDTYEIDDDGRKFHYEYEESIVPVTDGEENWGNMDFVSAQVFDPATKAKAATAVIQLDDGIDFNDVQSLVGRSITLGTGTGYYGARTFYFTDGTVKIPNAPTSSQAIDITNPQYNTTEKALQLLCRDIGYYKDFTCVDSAKLDISDRTITLTAEMKQLNDGSYQSDGVTYPNVISDGLCDWANGIKIAYTWKDEVNLDQIDGDDARNNQPIYSDKATATIRLNRLGTKITAESLKNLQGNSLTFGCHKVDFKDIGMFEGMTLEQFGNALAAKINEIDGCSAKYNKSARNMTLTMSGLSTSESNARDIKEQVGQEIYHYDSANMWKTSALNATSSIIRNATAEWSEISEIEINSNFSSPTAFSFNGKKYIYYNSTTHSLTHIDGAEPWFDYLSAEDFTIVDVAGKDENQIIQDIGARLAEDVSGVFSMSGNKIMLTAGNLNRPMNLDTTLKGETINVTSSKKIIDSEGTSPVLGTQYSDSLGTFQKTAQVSFSLGDGSNIKNLVGAGFSVGSCKVEFTDGTIKSDRHTGIDISSCTNLADFKTMMESQKFNNASFVIDDSNKSDIKLIVNMENVAIDLIVTDGNEGSKGLIRGDEVSYSGGTNVGYSQKEIDFSSITQDNLSDLLGTGFRINCPTCSGEYINVFFCWEKNESMPTTFSKIDDETGMMRTIHNIAVELSKVNDTSKIAQNIVDQVKPSLNHFMDISVGENGVTIVAKEKRIGDVTDENGNICLGSIQTGVAANFKYEVIVKKVYDDDPPEVIDPPVIDPDPIDPIPVDPEPIPPSPVDPEIPENPPVIEHRKSDLLIYVGSDPSAQYISIHLPYLDLDTLDLSCADVISSEDSRKDLLTRIDKADITISSIQGTIGADENRLQHARSILSNYHENLCDAESTIRDTDIAQTLMKHIKDQILSRAQYAMIAQANQVPHSVIQLIR